MTSKEFYIDNDQPPESSKNEDESEKISPTLIGILCGISIVTIGVAVFAIQKCRELKELI